MAVLSVYSMQKELNVGRPLAVDIKDFHCDRDMYIVQDRRRVPPLPARLCMAWLDTYMFPDPAA